jgi:hypothetical protein
MAGPAAGSAAGRVGQGRWGLVGWVDWAGQTGTRVVHPHLLPLAILDNFVGDQPGLPTRSLTASQNELFFVGISHIYAAWARYPPVGKKKNPRWVKKYGFGK